MSYTADHSFLPRHALALVLALVVGILTVIPFAWFAFHSPGYSGIALMGADAEEHYVARIQQLQIGKGAGDIFLEIHEPYIIPALGEWLIGKAGSLLGLGGPAANVASKFIFPFCIALLLYAFLYTLFTSRAAALLGAACILLGDNLLSGPFFWLGLIHGSSSITQFITYARPINPEVSALFLFGALYLLYVSFFTDKSTWWQTLLAGLLAGGALYVSIYVFSFLAVVLLLSCGLFLWKREYAKARATLGTGIIALFCGIPFVLNYPQVIAVRAYVDASLRQGLIHSHTPSLGVWAFLLLISVLFAWPRRFAHTRPFFIILSVALFIVLEQQMITGRSIQLSHYHWYITKPLVCMVLAMYAVYLAERFLSHERVQQTLYAMTFLILFYNASLIQAASYRAHYAAALAAQNYTPLLASVRHDSDVLWADRELSTYLSMYTSVSVPNNNYLQYYLVSTDYLERRLLLEYRLRGITPQEILSLMQKERADIAQRIYGVYWRDQYGSYESLPDSTLASLAAQYPSVYEKKISTLFKELSISQIVWDTRAEPRWGTVLTNDVSLTQQKTIAGRFIIFGYTRAEKTTQIP